MTVVPFAVLNCVVEDTFFCEDKGSNEREEKQRSLKSTFRISLRSGGRYHGGRIDSLRSATGNLYHIIGEDYEYTNRWIKRMMNEMSLQYFFIIELQFLCLSDINTSLLSYSIIMYKAYDIKL